MSIRHLGLPEIRLLEGPQSLAVDVLRAFDVFLRIGSALSNTYIGSLRACANLYLRAAALPGDEIRILCGGVFLAPPGLELAFDATVELDEKHLFEKRYSDRIVTWPADALGAPHAPRERTRNLYSARAELSLRAEPGPEQAAELRRFGRWERFGRNGDIIFTQLDGPDAATLHHDIRALAARRNHRTAAEPAMAPVARPAS